MSHDQLTPTHDSAEHWLAYRYLSGDLSVEEAASFEERLATDMAAQTALADSVLLTTGLAQLARPQAMSAPRRQSHTEQCQTVPRHTVQSHTVQRHTVPRSPHWPVALASAAVCLVGFSLMMQSRSIDPGEVVRHESTGAEDDQLDASSVVALWSVLGTDDEADFAHADFGHADFGHTEGRHRGESLADEEIDVPDWMLLAVLDEDTEGENALPDDTLPDEREQL